MKLKASRSGKISRRLLSRRDPTPKGPVAPTEREFNLRRRMFGIVDGVVHVAPERTPMFHREWFAKEGLLPSGDDRAFDRVVRGFADHRGLFLYKGAFDGRGVVSDLDPAIMQDLRDRLGLTDDTKVWLGLQPSESELWRGASLWGKLRDVQTDLADMASIDLPA